MAITKMRFFAECCRRCPPARPLCQQKRTSIRISLPRLGAKSHVPAIARSSREEPARLPPGWAALAGNGQNEPTTVRETKRGNDQARSGNGQTSKDTERARGHAAHSAAREARCDRRLTSTSVSFEQRRGSLTGMRRSLERNASSKTMSKISLQAPHSTCRGSSD